MKDRIIDYLMQSSIAGAIALVLGLAIFGALALTPLMSVQGAIVCGLGACIGTFIGNLAGRLLFG